MNFFTKFTAFALVGLALVGCQDPQENQPENEREPPVVDSGDSEALQELMSTLSELQDMSADEVLAEHDPPFSDDLGYDPLAADNLEIIQDSALAMNDDELATFGEQGFVITDRWLFPTFGYGYVNLYAEDLPVFVSADSLLFALHRSYSSILQDVEINALIPELRLLLEGMRDALSDDGLSWASASVRAEVDLYLAIAQSLLDGEAAAPVAGAEAGDISAWVSDASAAEGMQEIEFFGDSRRVDFSQFAPRGHYKGTPVLENYFRAMMWLGRIDLRLVEPNDQGELEVHAHQAKIAAGLVELMSESQRQRWHQIDQTLAAFVGPSDNMKVGDLERLIEDLGLGSPADFDAIDPQDLADTLAADDYGDQRIASHIMINGTGQGTLPLSHSFLLLGQRYTVDAEVFSNVVYDRVPEEPYRMMPDPLDAAFAALQNDQAAQLLEEEMNTYDYAGDLKAMRHLIDSLGDDYWDSTMYTAWVGALRSLSPVADDVADPDAAGLPSVAASEAWGRRLLNTQLASWAELRHDTLLYAKQSYSTGAVCEYPDAYVDPYPEFYARMANFAATSRTLLGSLDFEDTYTFERLDGYFETMETVHTTLEEMALRQRAGDPLDEEHLEFINRQVTIMEGCAGPDGLYGWYGDLFYTAKEAVEFDPTIADVHTAPTDAGGNPTGDVLHVATGHPRLMITTFDTCEGPRAYAGVVASYFEKQTTDFDRYDDQRWADDIEDGHPDDLWWMQDLVVR